MDVAMVCLGNICRSPMAEAVASALVREAGLSDLVSIESFGTASYHVGERAHPQAEAALRRRGWPVGDHRARNLRRRDLDRLDLVLCADRANLAEVHRVAGSAGVADLGVADLGVANGQVGTAAMGARLDPVDRTHLRVGRTAAPQLGLLRSFDADAEPGDNEVPDPWGGLDADFDRALDLIERACRGLVAALAVGRR
ncbi:MAG: low molecular weight protein-tyrosine-phosphatase [Acidimicrobiales bacterium]